MPTSTTPAPGVTLAGLAFSLLLAATLAAAPAAQTAAAGSRAGFELADYLPGAVGDFWSFQESGHPEPWLLTVAEARTVGGLPTRRWDDSSGGYLLLALDSQRGLLLLRSETPDGVSAVFDPPQVLAPPVVEIGARYQDESVYQEVVDGQVAGDGRQRVTVAIAKPEAFTSLAGTFAACLPIEVEITRESSAGERVVSSLVVLLARGVGPVKVHFSQSAMYHLVEAAVGDRIWPPDPPD